MEGDNGHSTEVGNLTEGEWSCYNEVASLMDGEWLLLLRWPV